MEYHHKAQYDNWIDKHFTEWLRGMIAYIAMTDKTTAARFTAQLDKVATI